MAWDSFFLPSQLQPLEVYFVYRLLSGYILESLYLPLIFQVRGKLFAYR